jgi:hypothetical protein
MLSFTPSDEKNETAISNFEGDVQSQWRYPEGLVRNIEMEIQDLW